MTRPDFDPHRELNLADLQVTGPPSVRQYDMDHDGKIDHILYDLDGDGQIERMEVDENGDGRIDTIYQNATHPGDHAAVYHDYDHDGTFENVWMDTNADGKIDEIREDPNEDGNPEKVSRDSDFNGSFDQTTYDDNSDGQVDRVANDTDGDGNPDRIVPVIHSTSIYTGDHIGSAQGVDVAFGTGQASAVARATESLGVETMGSAGSLHPAASTETMGLAADATGHPGVTETMGEASMSETMDPSDAAQSFGHSPELEHPADHFDDSLASHHHIGPIDG